MNSFFKDVIVPAILMIMLLLGTALYMSTFPFQEANDVRYKIMSQYAEYDFFPENVNELATEKLSDGYLTNSEYNEVDNLYNEIEDNNSRIEKSEIIRKFKED